MDSYYLKIVKNNISLHSEQEKEQYSFKLQKTDKQMGQVTYVSAYPSFDKNTKGYNKRFTRNTYRDDW